MLDEDFVILALALEVEAGHLSRLFDLDVLGYELGVLVR